MKFDSMLETAKAPEPTDRYLQGPFRVLAMDIDIRGHHPSYVRNFAKTWAEYNIQGNLDFLVSHRFFELHPDETKYVQSLSSHGIRIISLTQAEDDRMEAIPYLRYFQAWKLFCKYSKSLESNHGLLMFSDYLQLPMLIGKQAPCPFSMIYFRPTFHYQILGNYHPPWKERFRAWRKKLLMKRVLKIARLARVYCLDNFAVEFIKDHFRPKASIEFLPDSFATFPMTATELESMRLELGIDSSRKIFCLVGILDRRKGVRELLEAIQTLSEAASKQVCVLLVGELHVSQEVEIIALLEQTKNNSQVQVVLRNDFVPEEDVQKYYELSDVTLTTYQNHMGGSSALIRSALAKRPVLSSDHGLMGEIVRKRQLGLTVDATKPHEIAKGILAFLDDRPECKLNLKSAQTFVEENSSARLAEALKLLTITRR
ncbi:MAG: glycosyltransferase family 4 protein [Planctomycetota bacterium]|nr:glycosyltransferase family 4 protein [Planctomycetota bacterium]